MPTLTAESARPSPRGSSAPISGAPADEVQRGEDDVGGQMVDRRDGVEVKRNGEVMRCVYAMEGGKAVPWRQRRCSLLAASFGKKKSHARKDKLDNLDKKRLKNR